MLKGRSIALRLLQDSDLDFLEKIENNKENWKFGSEKKQYSKQELADYITNAKTDISIAKQYRFVIDLKNTPIGFIDLFNYTTRSAEVGVIITKDYRGKGFATEALNLLTDYAFFVLDINQLYASVTKDNLQSIKLFTSCGFDLQREKTDLDHFIKLAKK
ncbi:MAG: GNAT family N-acetyltransferase [Bacteroidota bacterium]|nr:GNAT family N-acetyltransferase [Bacteroidota bacterium]